MGTVPGKPGYVVIMHKSETQSGFLLSKQLYCVSTRSGALQQSTSQREMLATFTQTQRKYWKAEESVPFFLGSLAGLLN